jgi:hypothetical protein
MTQGIERWQAIQRALHEIEMAAQQAHDCFDYLSGELKVDEGGLFDQIVLIGEAQQRAKEAWRPG